MEEDKREEIPFGDELQTLEMGIFLNEEGWPAIVFFSFFWGGGAAFPPPFFSTSENTFNMLTLCACLRVQLRSFRS